MATSIPAGTASPPQARKQIMDADGNFQPVPDIPQVSAPAPVEPSIPEFKIGDAVIMTGRVVEVHSPQGGQTSVKVQMEGQAEWFRAGHLKHDTGDTDAEAAKQANEQSLAEQSAKHNAVIEGLKTEVNAAKAVVDGLKSEHIAAVKALEDKISALQTEAKAAATENKQ